MAAVWNPNTETVEHIKASAVSPLSLPIYLPSFHSDSVKCVEPECECERSSEEGCCLRGSTWSKRSLSVCRYTNSQAVHTRHRTERERGVEMHRLWAASEARVELRRSERLSLFYMGVMWRSATSHSPHCVRARLKTRLNERLDFYRD